MPESGPGVPYIPATGHEGIRGPQTVTATRYRPSRRTVLAGGLGLAAVAACGAGGYQLVQDGTLPGRYKLARLTGACQLAPGPLAGPLPSRHQVSFHSAYRRRDVQMVTLIPAAAASPAGLGVVIALHGSGAARRPWPRGWRGR
jgi:hypothetical protein